MMRETIYFGRNRPSGGVVSESDWQSFLNDFVTPRFSNGLTVIDARGQWRGASGKVEGEQSKVLTVYHRGTDAEARLFNEVVSEYQERFAQEAVFREFARTCARF